MLDISINENRIAISGALTQHTVKRAWSQTPDFSHKNLEVEMKALDRVDSAGFALLVYWSNEAKRQDSILVYRNPPEKLMDIAGLTGLESILQP